MKTLYTNPTTPLYKLEQPNMRFSPNIKSFSFFKSKFGT